MTHLSYVHQLETIKGRLFNDLTLNGVGGGGGEGGEGVAQCFKLFSVYFFSRDFLVGVSDQ